MKIVNFIAPEQQPEVWKVLITSIFKGESYFRVEAKLEELGYYLPLEQYSSFIDIVDKMQELCDKGATFQ